MVRLSSNVADTVGLHTGDAYLPPFISEAVYDKKSYERETDPFSRLSKHVAYSRLFKLAELNEQLETIISTAI
jgi:hypothetical protein